MDITTRLKDMLGDSDTYTPHDYIRYIGKDDPILDKILVIFKDSSFKKDYYYIYVKRDIDNTWSHYVYTKRFINTSKLMLDEQHIYDYQNIYVVETNHDTLNIQSVKIYDTRKDTTTTLLNLKDIQQGVLSDLVKQIQSFISK